MHLQLTQAAVQAAVLCGPYDTADFLVPEVCVVEEHLVESLANPNRVLTGRPLGVDHKTTLSAAESHTPFQK